MNYAIETLEKEKSLIEKALSDWETKQYPEAKKQREKRFGELNEAIKNSKQAQHNKNGLHRLYTHINYTENAT